MSDISSSSDERQDSQSARGRGRRVRKVILIGTIVACTAGAITTSVSSFSPPKTSAAYPPGFGTPHSTPSAAPPEMATPVPPTVPGKKPHNKEKKPKKKPDDAVLAAYSASIAEGDIPALALAAYHRAAQEQAFRTPGCHLPWTLLAAIGKVESNHARGGALTEDGFTASPILGPVLNGGSFASLHDSDQGKLDGDSTWDRAVGPMQFIPPTWKRWGTTTRSAPAADPSNIFDASTSAAAYLCAGNRDLSDPLQLKQAILSYNPSQKYLQDVLAWDSAYASGDPATGVLSAVDNGPLVPADSLGDPSTPPASPAEADNSDAHKGAHKPGGKTSHADGDQRKTPRKATPHVAARMETASPQRPDKAHDLFPLVPPAHDPTPSPEPKVLRPSLLGGGLPTPFAPSASPEASPRGVVGQTTDQLTGLVRGVGSAPSALLLPGSTLADDA
ncbi:hypothetical protein [Streptomyces sp. L2]|uniref:lytic transglycosylase domain-containing protein n=1 Tax=Streptomyces sp. L2 TaxID=2162665 RepID=UPI0010124747|nr:hypothetical protein [Streptomyces sp. L2]